MVTILWKTATWGSELCNQSQTQQQISRKTSHLCFQQTLSSQLLNSTPWVDYILLKGKWKGRVNVGFPCLQTPTVARYHLGRKQQFVLLVGTFFPLTLCTMNWKMENTSRYSPILLKLSDKVLLNFFILPIFSAGWEAGIRSHILLFLFQRVWQRTGCVVWSGEERPAFSQPCGASSAQLQRASKQETEPQRLALLSSTSSETTIIISIIQLHFRRCNENPLWSRSIHSGNRALSAAPFCCVSIG